MSHVSVQSVTVLGATGSIGKSTLDVIARHPERYRVYALTAHTSKEALLDQCKAHSPRFAVLDDVADAQWLQQALRQAGSNTVALAGEDALCEVAQAPEVDTVMAAIVGAAGLLPSLAAAEAGKRVLLANKEALVMSGALFMDAVARSGATLLPIDSEHNAIYQCLPSEHRGGLAKHGVRQLLLTASGGPFRGWSAADIANVTPEQACAHPNWSMGRKISVDSATLMNKGLELIEACWLFDATPEQIQVVVHPQSVIHSMAAYNDGSVIAQLGNPDMRTPIAYGLAWPERIDAGVETLDLFQVARLDFEAPDETRFPCLRLAREAMQAGGAAPAVLNAANEVAVEAFLAGNIAFGAIPDVVAKVMALPYPGQADSLERVLAADRWAREQAAHTIRQLTA
ncbi:MULTISPECIES: 1-deoxy-D-xylulose-5-phosphate reductoisomerase [Halomonadaceae]|jgi:1-deoxy-D-xylulose-5-phosphate reductoisomerase|uniref:1-deoxy-D-xylulose 5-phosphate reductoisomerase n=1 Tax=Vreelandella aquamarina TaxID=77097 RepID=A0A0D7UWE6_9GAMM|nr:MULTISPECIES: 1-deoxy-D-xylulose-5-phosphate reductoisomerase [Halomonas]KTG23058.1 1-deoxy-D-xylulose 5-phosphate reductoisomerase [Idiomarina sp. H105]MEC7295583.1 1-deoxy-D-xylulose-5-phosphate reductoisomerase [Pseudomonadota bacterium]OAE89939.1 1-deoxy-D-xylulose 5-phosphate reductoisomerase [Idiomarina sp. WRN-38]KJD18984.1 1-deoxy-D-xylulose 5-phosphate reductoisomerase [Halomonas meridiana]MAM03151.1 1-deoxy-D-xylulose-5-phosphate reductoisomerase [Halomonas sp.]|tara:strand:- start:1049 stop:2245 length:1197 start_codon:yes stop_codon:yes gene_type:complete